MTVDFAELTRAALLRPCRYFELHAIPHVMFSNQAQGGTFWGGRVHGVSRRCGAGNLGVPLGAAVCLTCHRIGGTEFREMSVSWSPGDAVERACISGNDAWWEARSW